MILTVTINPAIDETVEIPSFRAGAVNRVAQVHRGAGGKGVNVAAALSEFGVGTCTTGFLGEENDKIFTQLLGSKGIEDRFVRIPGSTRTGIKIIDPAVGETTDINYPGLTPTDEQLRTLYNEIEVVGRSADWAVLSGSLPPGVPETVYGELIELLRSVGCRSALDVSGRPLKAAMDAVPDMVKPNIHELEEYTGRSISTVAEASAEAARLIERGVSLVAVSMGERGALVQEGETAILVHPVRVEVKSTVGAGDAMVAGILAGIVGGMSLQDAGRLGAAFATSALSHTGPGIPSREAVLSMLEHVSTESVHG